MNKERINELYPIALRLVIRKQKIHPIENATVSTSFLQRIMRIGYSTAKDLLDMLEENGVIQSQEHGQHIVIRKKTRMKLTKEQWEQLQNIHKSYIQKQQGSVRMARQLKKFVEETISKYEGVPYKHDNAIFLKRGYDLRFKGQGEGLLYSLWLQEEKLGECFITGA